MATINSSKAMEEALRQQRASLDKQRQAIHRQVGEKPQQTISPVEPVIQFIDPIRSSDPPDCPPLDDIKATELILSAARKQSLDPALLRAVIKQESGFKPCAVSLKGALGLMQLMPSTARAMHVSNAFDPAQNVQAGAAYLRSLLDRYKGDIRLALVGYNAGPARADQPAGIPYPLETQNYIANILADLGIGNPESEPVTQEDLAPTDDSRETSNSNSSQEQENPSPPEST